MSSQALEQIVDNVLVPTIGQDRIYQTIDTYTSGTIELYSFDPPKPMEPITVSRPINKPYGQHENKLIDSKGITTVYSDFQKDNLKLDIFHNELGISHKEKENILNIILPYKNMFDK